MSGIFTDLSYFGGLVNTNIRANINTPLNLTHGGRPSGIPPNTPTVPVLNGGAGSTAISIYFTHVGDTGTPPITYTGLYSTSATGTYSVCQFNNTSGNATVANATGLTPNTPYYFKARATNAYGGSTSSYAMFTTASAGTAPSGPPTVPTNLGANSSAITVSFDTTGITGTAPITYSVVYGTTTSSFPFTSTDITPQGAGVYSCLATGLSSNTTYYFKSVATNSVGSQQSAVSAGMTTDPPPDLMTNLYMTFLTPTTGYGYYDPSNNGSLQPTNSMNWILNSDAPNGTASQTYGDYWCSSVQSGLSALSPVPTTLNGAGGCYNTNGDNYTMVSNAYLQPIRDTAGVTLMLSLGGFYADLLGMFGPLLSPPGGAAPGFTFGSSVELMNSIAYTFYNVSTAPNPLGWSRASWGALEWKGLNLDFENIGYGGRVITNGYPNNRTVQYPTIPGQVPGSTAGKPVFPADANTIIPGQAGGNVRYMDYIDAIRYMIVHHYNTYGGDFYLTTAPIAAAINGDQNTNITATQNALGTWFAFPSNTTVPSSATFNSAGSNAMLHPTVLCYFDDVFVQFYNSDPANYLGGANFANLLAQWGYLALQAQASGVGYTTTKINIGLAKGQVSNITSQSTPPPVATYGVGGGGNAGPTAVYTPAAEPGPLYSSWYPQFATAAPPNASAFYFPDISEAGDAATLNAALAAANAILRTATARPTLNIVDWCSGVGCWAGAPALQMVKGMYDGTNANYVANLPPTGYASAWAEAYFPAVQPGWAGNVPVNVVAPTPPAAPM